jgi:membrane protein HdeD
MANARSSWFTIEGVILILLGVVAFVLPVAAGLAAALVLGWILLLSGIVGLVALFVTRGQAHAGWGFLSALIAIVAGLLLLLFDPFAGAVSIAFLLAAYLVLDGIALVLLGIDLKNRGAAGWIWVLLSGIVDWLLAALILAISPAGAPVLLGLLVGIDLVAAGIALLRLGAGLRGRI